MSKENYLQESAAKLRQHRVNTRGMLWKQIPLTIATAMLVTLIVGVLTVSPALTFAHVVSVLLAGYSIVLNVQGWRSYYRCRYWVKMMESTYKFMEDMERNAKG